MIQFCTVVAENINWAPAPVTLDWPAACVYMTWSAGGTVPKNQYSFFFGGGDMHRTILPVHCIPISPRGLDILGIVFYSVQDSGKSAMLAGLFCVSTSTKLQWPVLPERLVVFAALLPCSVSFEPIRGCISLANSAGLIWLIPKCRVEDMISISPDMWRLCFALLQCLMHDLSLTSITEPFQWLCVATGIASGSGLLAIAVKVRRK